MRVYLYRNYIKDKTASAYIFALLLLSMAIMLIVSLLPMSLYNAKLNKINSYLIQSSYLCDSGVQDFTAEIESTLYIYLSDPDIIKGKGTNIKELVNKKFDSEEAIELEFNRAFMKDYKKSVESNGFKARLKDRFDNTINNLNAFNNYNSACLESIDSVYVDIDKDFCIIELPIQAKINGYAKTVEAVIYVDMPKFDLENISCHKDKLYINPDSTQIKRVDINNRIEIVLKKERDY